MATVQELVSARPRDERLAVFLAECQPVIIRTLGGSLPGLSNVSRTMKHAREATIAAIAALALTFADRAVVSGPYLGTAGILLSIVAALIGWYAGRAAAGLTAGSPSGGYTMVPLASFTVFGALIFAALAYVKIFDLAKVDYTMQDVAIHLVLVALAAFIIRMAASSVGRLTA
jgi:hypothetical protein